MRWRMSASSQTLLPHKKMTWRTHIISLIFLTCGSKYWLNCFSQHAVKLLKQGTRKNLSLRRTTTTKRNTVIMGAQCLFWFFVIDFELLSSFFMAPKHFLEKFLLFRIVSRFSNIRFWKLCIGVTTSKWKANLMWRYIFFRFVFFVLKKKNWFSFLILIGYWVL